MATEYIKDLYRRQALGDEEAIEQLAQITEGRYEQQAQQQAKHSGAAAEYNGLLSAYKKHSADIWDDPEGLKVAERKLQSLIRNNPDMTLETAFEFITDSARGLLGDPEERGNKEWIAQQQKFRQARTQGEREEATSLNEVLEERVDDEDQQRWSAGIKQLEEERRPRPNIAAIEEREYEAKKPRAQRGERMFPHPSNTSAVPVYNSFGQRIG